MSDVVRVGVVGLGFMGQTHVAAYQSADGVTLVAVADADEARRTGHASAGGNLDSGASSDRLFDPAAVRGYATAEELFANDDVDLVSICTPTPSHVDLAAAAMRAGKHVLVEKPIAVDTRQIERLAGIAAETKRYCMPAMCMRFWPGWTWLRDTIADKSLGQLRSLSLQRIGARPGWNGFYADTSQSGGALVDLHVHDSDFVHFCLGRPAGVTSVGHVDAVTTMYHYDDADLRVVAEGAWHHEGTDFRMRYVADFDAGTADFDIARDEPLQLARGGALTPVDLPAGNGYDGEIRHMVQAVAEGQSPDVTLADAIATHRLLDAERDSLERRVRVDLPRL